MTTVAAIMPAIIANPDHDRESRTTVTFAYNPADPYAIAMTIHGDVDIIWHFARELLVAGLTRPAGYGDVTVHPGCPMLDADIGIVLTSPDGQCLVEIPRYDVQRFLHRTDAAVPLGFEVMDFDAELAAFLDGAR